MPQQSSSFASNLIFDFAAIYPIQKYLIISSRLEDREETINATGIQAPGTT